MHSARSPKAPRCSSMAKVSAILIGFGNVNRRLLLELARFKEGVEVVCVFSSRGGVEVKAESDFSSLLRLAESGQKLSMHPGFKHGFNVRDCIDKLGEPSVAFIALPPSYETGEPNLNILRLLLENGVNVITADKTALALDYANIMEKARKHGIFIGYRATVAAGTPAIDLVRGLVGRDVVKIEAVLNATTNYVISLVERGYSFSEAVSSAVREQLAEPDPRIDIEGWDAAAKIAILASELGYRYTLHSVKRTPLTSVSESEIREALEKNARYRYIAVFDREEGRLEVAPKAVSKDDLLAQVSGIYNGIVIELEGEKIALTGPVGPAWRTAKVMVTDLLELLRHLERHI